MNHPSDDTDASVAKSGKLGMDIDITQLTVDRKCLCHPRHRRRQNHPRHRLIRRPLRLESHDGPRASLLYVGEARERATLFAYQLTDAEGEQGPIAVRKLDPRAVVLKTGI